MLNNICLCGDSKSEKRTDLKVKNEEVNAYDTFDFGDK